MSYKGVTKSGDQFKAQIYHLGKVINVGVFSSDLLAAKAYDEKSRQLNGNDTKKINFALEVKRESNLKVHSEKTGTYKGVSFDEKENLWKAEVSVLGSIEIIGFYDTEEKAAMYHDEAIYGLICPNVLRIMEPDERAKLCNFTHDEYCSLAFKEILK